MNSYIFVKVFTSKLRHSRLFAIKINKTIELFNVEKRLIVAPSILIRGILQKIVTIKKTIVCMRLVLEKMMMIMMKNELLQVKHVQWLSEEFCFSTCTSVLKKRVDSGGEFRQEQFSRFNE